MRPTILWDMDGTLVDSEPFHERALVETLRSHGAEPPPDFHALVVGRDAASIHAFCVERLGVKAGLHEWLTAKYRVYFTLIHDLKGRPGALELYRRLRRRGAVQAIVSNSDRLVVSANLQAAGLAEPGLVTVSRNDVREGKPAPECYLRAAWLLATDPAHCVAVEDSGTGATAALAAGCRTLFWPQDPIETPHGAERIDSAEALAAALEAA